MREAVLEPARPIIDPHHHLWDMRRHVAAMGAPENPFDDVLRRVPRYLLDELLADLDSGHDVRATVCVEAGVMHRASGPKEMAPVGETEFANGVAAMGASGVYGDRRPCAGIVSRANLTLGPRVQAVLEAHIAAGGGRFRGVRQSSAYDADPQVLQPSWRVRPTLLGDADFRSGFRHLAALDLSFETWMLEPQLPQLIDLARAFPDTRICLDHVATPLGIGHYRREERFDMWRANIQALARCPNVSVKLGGLGMHFPGFASYGCEPPATSAQLAQEWRPYVETCIEAFSPSRAMFESNFPVDVFTCDYATLWNAFKRLAAQYSEDEKHQLFFGSAARFYRLEI